MLPAPAHLLVTVGPSPWFCSIPGMDPYASAGVDEEREQDVFARVMRPWLARTKVRSPLVTHITGLASGYFATLMHIPPGPPLALTTDGVGTKILLAREANRWEPVGIDCVANNVNDVICVGAVPLALLDYMATDRIDEDVLAAVARGLYQGAEEAGIAIPGGEIAQIGAMLAPSAGGPPMLDLVGTAVGALPPGRAPVDGSLVRAGDVILALPSSGLHSNGYSLARRALFELGGLTLDSQVPGTGQRLDDALLAPTRVYVRAAEALWEAGVSPRGLAHISGGGLLNLARLAADVSYELDALPPAPPVFALIAEAGRIPPETMYATFNMGTGFCVVVSPAETQLAVDALKSAGEQPVVAGSVTGRPGRYVSIPSVGLLGRGDGFPPGDDAPGDLPAHGGAARPVPRGYRLGMDARGYVESNARALTPLESLALARGTVDRVTHRRNDKEWLDAAWADPRTRVLVVSAGRALVRLDDEHAELIFVSPPEAPAGTRFLLGQDADAVVYFGVSGDLPAALPPATASTARPASLREVGSLLGDRDAGLLTHAVALAIWHDTHTHCPIDGTPTVPDPGGHSTRCPADGTEHFPRTDPAVIMLVTDPDDRCLLARNAAWPGRRVSILAGFVDPGESAEQAVIREVAEETQIKVTNVRYVGSQPWPMPRSLMLGFRAEAPAGQAIVVDREEIAEAYWFSREELLAAIKAREIALPPPVSIARHIIESWFGGPLPSTWTEPRP